MAKPLGPLIRCGLTPIEGDLPNQTSVNFEDRFELVGFELEPRRVKPGETVHATFYWKLQEPTDINYTFYAQIPDPDTTRWAAVDAGQTTADWTVGEVQTLSYALELREDTPPDVYWLRLGIYTQADDGSFPSLQRVTPDGQLTDDFINLTIIRVDE